MEVKFKTQGIYVHVIGKIFQYFSDDKSGVRLKRINVLK